MIRYTALVLIHFVVLSSFTLARNGKPGKLVFNVTSTSCDSVCISWEPPTKEKKDITGYRIHIKIQDPMIINGKSYNPRISFITSLTEINVTNLTQEVVYRFSISAINYSDGTGEAGIMNVTVIPKDNIIEHLLRTIFKYLKTGISISMVIGGTTFVLGAPALVYLLGFTGGGIAAGSIGAWLMSITGPVASGSLVAILQSIGAAGFSLAAKILLFAAGASTGGGSIFGLTYIFSDDCAIEAVPVNF